MSRFSSLFSSLVIIAMLFSVNLSYAQQHSGTEPEEVSKILTGITHHLESLKSFHADVTMDRQYPNASSAQQNLPPPPAGMQQTRFDYLNGKFATEQPLPFGPGTGIRRDDAPLLRTVYDGSATYHVENYSQSRNLPKTVSKESGSKIASGPLVFIRSLDTGDILNIWNQSRVAVSRTYNDSRFGVCKEITLSPSDQLSRSSGVGIYKITVAPSKNYALISSQTVTNDLVISRTIEKLKQQGDVYLPVEAKEEAYGRSRPNISLEIQRVERYTIDFSRVNRLSPDLFSVDLNPGDSFSENGIYWHIGANGEKILSRTSASSGSNLLLGCMLIVSVSLLIFSVIHFVRKHQWITRV